MFGNLNILSGKHKYLYGLILLAFISLICVAFNTADNDDYEIARREMLLRKVGHELLLQSGDSTSRVLPIEKIADNEYRIRFENEFTFQPDFLVNTTRNLLAGDLLTQDYVVNVLDCTNLDVTYGYSISKDKKDDIVACTGREQPKGCYIVNIKFKPAGLATAKNGYLLGGLSFLAFAGLVFFRSAKPRNTLPDVQYTDALAFGAMLFDANERKLTIHEKTIDLTVTETRLLLIFALSPNEIIERSRLQKEIWEDEGVIVGRSLDMFISKLRKKLEADPNVNIVVVRGKGYKLEISS